MGSAGIFNVQCESKNGADCQSLRQQTLCRLSQPVLCILDLDAPIPETLNDGTHWTGSLLALSAPIQGDALGTLSEANLYCVQTFGEAWRVASFHDGGGDRLQGYGAPPLRRTRVWIDIRTAPQATCWSR
jgi:hypothetical protein